MPSHIPWVIVECILQALTMVNIPVYQKNTFETKNIEGMSNGNGSIVEDAVTIWFIVHRMVSRWSNCNTPTSVLTSTHITQHSYLFLLLHQNSLLTCFIARWGQSISMKTLCKCILGCKRLWTWLQIPNLKMQSVTGRTMRSAGSRIIAVMLLGTMDDEPFANNIWMQVQMAISLCVLTTDRWYLCTC